MQMLEVDNDDDVHVDDDVVLPGDVDVDGDDLDDIIILSLHLTIDNVLTKVGLKESLMMMMMSSSYNNSTYQYSSISKKYSHSLTAKI